MMKNNWIKIYASGDMFKVELLRQLLEENDIEAVILNKKDSSYQFGEVQLLVNEQDRERAQELISNNP